MKPFNPPASKHETGNYKEIIYMNRNDEVY